MTERELKGIEYIQADRILPDPLVGNIGGDGRTHDTTDLQPSIREHGVIEPLDVRPGPDGTYYLINGARRLTAARQVDANMRVPVIVRDVGEEALVELQALLNLHTPHPDIVVNGSGEVVGGWCFVAWHEAQRGRRNYEIADTLGVTTDTAGAYVRLYDDLPELKSAVASGKMAITVYSLLKTAPEEVKRYVAQQRGQITAGFVRDALRNWGAIKEKEHAARREDDPGKDVAQDTDDDTPERMEEIPVAALLNTALRNVRMCVGRELADSDYYIVEQLADVLEEI